MGFNEISANEKPYFKNFSFFSFSSEAYKDGNIGAKILLIRLRLGHPLNIVLYFKITETIVYICVYS